MQPELTGVLGIYDGHFLPNNACVNLLKNLFFDSYFTEHLSTYRCEQFRSTLVTHFIIDGCYPDHADQKVVLPVCTKAKIG